MNKKTLFVIFLSVFLLINIAVVSADDDIASENINGTELEVPSITIDSSNVYTGDSLNIYLKDSNQTPLVGQQLTANINKENHSLFTDLQGKSTLNLLLKPKKYVLSVFFEGNENFSSVNQTFNINVLKLNTKIIIPENPTFVKGDYLYVYLKDQNNNAISQKNVIINVNGVDYTKVTNNNGRASLKIGLNPATYSMYVSFQGDDYYNSAYKSFKMVIQATTSIVIGNDKLLSQGYLRIYLKSETLSAVSKKTVIITFGNKTFTKTTNSEGIIVLKPNVGVGTFNVTATFKGDSKTVGSDDSKIVVGIKGTPKSPLKAKIPLKNGVPDVDYMTSNYVMAADDMTYTLTKTQYKSVIKRDSYCLYLNNKLSKYTFFKSKGEPNLNHIVKREKWNVIERAINTRIVQVNKKNYWPSQITVSLKGKSYTYPEVRDVQNTGYTCGPTSSSMCSQVLRNYICESQLSKQSGSSAYSGSSTSGLKKGLEKNNFKCTIYYKSTFNKALNELKKGGCALIFHTWNHFVAILDISKDGKKVLLGNPSGDYDHGSHLIPTKWLTVSYMENRFNNYDTSGLIVKLKYSLSKATKTKINNFYSSMGTKWVRQNTNERIPQI